MDVFGLRDQLVRDYQSYITSFIHIDDARIRGHVERELKAGLLWPDPLIQLNPSFKPGDWIDNLVDRGILHDECRRVFRIKPTQNQEGKSLRLHQHQLDAIHAARSGANYVLTTGTGSGKSLAYIVPIVDHVLRHGSGRGIRAIIVYPMNALANSQYGELEKFLHHGYPDGNGPVQFARYTGQESDEERQAIIANPPDIILTNYVMLELMLTRPNERPLIEAAKGLKFLVLDELHTYRGRQGADVALLVRRVRDLLEADQLQCVGTSATLAGVGSYDEQRAEVANVASLLFGAEVHSEHVIGETLQRATGEGDPSGQAFVRALTERVVDPNAKPPDDLHAFIADPLSGWIESTFGVTSKPGTERLVRSRPRSITGSRGAAAKLCQLTGVAEERCTVAIQEALLAGWRHKDPDTDSPIFAFRLHQFISPGDAVYASIEPPSQRYVTLHGQQFVPGHRDRVLLPLVFCRECGQEYYSVRRSQDPESSFAVFSPRDLLDRLNDDDSQAGFLYLSEGNPWPDDPSEVVNRLPDDWLEEHRGTLRVRSSQRKNLPQAINVDPAGRQSEHGLRCHYLPAPFRFCLQCGVAFRSSERSDFAKLSSLGFEGRSTATTILSLSAVRTLRADDTLAERARKLLSFTDNRQDASLQAGHFNDFVETGLLRGALFHAALDAGPDGLRHEELTQRVFNTLALDPKLFASNPEAKFLAADETNRALRDVLGYRLYRDLKRGWRVTAPNLEQAGLLDIQYLSLDELCEAEEIWQGGHAALVTASPTTRQLVARTLLDYMRRELAIKVDYLDKLKLEQITQQSNQRLIPPWAIDENEPLEYATTLFPRPRQSEDYRGYVYLSPRGGFGQYLRRHQTFPDFADRISVDDTAAIIQQVLLALTKAGIVEVVQPPNKEGDVPGYQLVAAAMRWVAGDGTKALHDAIRVPHAPEHGRRTNHFFVDFYRTIALGVRGIEAHEHTAQVPYELREEREAAFRDGTLPVLFCSPTMELGVDISLLNVVGLRNVPPTPANYAQRSGRAGRSGQPALVFGYCATGSPHDQYYFKHPGLMVSGAVSPPRLELANEDLVSAHVHAIWLTETRQDLHRSLRDLLDLSGESPTLELLPAVQDSLVSPSARQRARARAERVLATIGDQLGVADWYQPDWLDGVINGAVRDFDRACARWRSLYQAASAQRELQNRIIGDASRSADDKKRARRLRSEAESQLELLTDIKSVRQSDFYSYRYFASEGFLPGYSFPRLPLAAFIPARRGQRGRDEFLQRPRFLAISEFGPRAIIYHEGSRYRINKVILPIRDDEDLPTASVKQCDVCGYLHPLDESDDPDLCTRCEKPLDQPLRQLFRLENVATHRQDRINSDEEERFRLGYEIRSGVRFATRSDRPSSRTATVTQGGETLAQLTYADAANLWRINLGWARRKDKGRYGFVLDTERGYWARNEQVEDDPEDPMSARTARVIPYVEDTRNCLLVEFAHQQSPAVMASLQAALKTAIQVRYQLEDNELAAEPLPSGKDRRLLLLFESAEGGAGVLRRLVDERQALAEVAQEALALCHFDPITGADRRHAPNRSEECEAACYDCLLSYFNQRDHGLLDRQAIKDLLIQLMAADVQTSPSPLSRGEHLQRLKNQCQSTLEKRWLDWLDECGLALPTHAQPLIESCGTRPDFVYLGDAATAIYIDGPHHDYPERQARDAEQQNCLVDSGFTVIRFGYEDDWKKFINEHAYIFGTVS